LVILLGLGFAGNGKTGPPHHQDAGALLKTPNANPRIFSALDLSLVSLFVPSFHPKRAA